MFFKFFFKVREKCFTFQHNRNISKCRENKKKRDQNKIAAAKAETFILIDTFWNNMSKSCITDLQIYYCPSKQNPLCTKPTSNSNPQQPLLQRIRIQSSAAPLKGGRVLQFGDQFDLSADIPTGAWSFPLSHLDTPDGVGNLSKIKFAHTIQRSVWLMLFCFLQ